MLDWSCWQRKRGGKVESQESCVLGGRSAPPITQAKNTLGLVGGTAQAIFPSSRTTANRPLLHLSFPCFRAPFLVPAPSCSGHILPACIMGWVSPSYKESAWGVEPQSQRQTSISTPSTITSTSKRSNTVNARFPLSLRCLGTHHVIRLSGYPVFLDRKSVV